MTAAQSTKTITIPEDEYAGMMAQISFLRAAMHALGGKYEVSYETFVKHGNGTMHLVGDNERRTLIATIVQGPYEDAPVEPPKSLETSEEVASQAAKILKRKSSTKAEKAVAASALTQRTGRKRITTPPWD